MTYLLEEDLITIQILLIVLIEIEMLKLILIM